ncbi:MAG: Nif3-like dinuclear metal center hexameric protein [Lachnoclostridium sp.]|nr:Nif3-like dinuclear metal center hexameric protein [Lachnoclostridium sp.]
MPTLEDIVSAIESVANKGYQESWDNTGWQVCPVSPDTECTGVMLSVDVTEAVIDEAIAKRCNLIISHHPLIFKPLRRIVGDTPAERMVIKLISSGISVYSCHTSLDSISGGVSTTLASMLGLSDIKILSPRRDALSKIVTYIPASHADNVREVMTRYGAGHIGNYDCCTFSTEGQGRFRALEGCKPYVGAVGEIHTEEEVKIEAVVPNFAINRLKSAIRLSHPYQEPVIDVFPMSITDQWSGLGAIGNLPAPVSYDELIARVKEVYGSPVVRTTAGRANRIVSRVALCGGSGGEFIPDAIAKGADAYVTSDVHYHDFVDYSSEILVIDTGHFESEKCTRAILQSIISEKFPNFAAKISESEQNSIQYH